MLRRTFNRFSTHYDLIVLGSGPAGQKCAIDSAKKGKRVAIIDKNNMIGGVCTHTGTIPSKTLREAIINTTGFRAKDIYGVGKLRRVNAKEILQQVRAVEARQQDVITYQLKRNNIDIISGFGRFVGPRSIQVSGTDSCLTAENIMISVGTLPNRAPEYDFSLKEILDSDEVISDDLVVPRSLIVVGGGVIGMEYASMISTIPGTRVTVVDKAPRVLPFVDNEIVDMLMTHFRNNGGRVVLNDGVVSSKVVPVDPSNEKSRRQVVLELKSGKKLTADAMLFAMGRCASTGGLDLDKIGVCPLKRGHLVVNEHFQVMTNSKDGGGEIVEGVYAAGDVIGIPALASTAMEQGRRASCHMWGDSTVKNFFVAGESFPYGIYTVPEISMVGQSEEQLTKDKVVYETGYARYSELARAQLVGGGDHGVGLLKMLFCPYTLKLYGVHVIGDGATEIVHIGQTVMRLGGTLEYFRNTVFNYPTFAEGYRVAALAGLSKAKYYKKPAVGDEPNVDPLTQTPTNPKAFEEAPVEELKPVEETAKKE
eukprot:PhM_4_TR18759/c0_g1_i1/m.55658/K00322/sthA, udhA; NAD(P) transhydrogenase